MVPPKKALSNQPPPPQQVEESSSEEEESSESESESESLLEQKKEKPNAHAPHNQNQTSQAKKKPNLDEKQINAPPPNLPQTHNQASQVKKKPTIAEKQTTPPYPPHAGPGNNEESEEGSEEEELEEFPASPSASDFTIKVISPKRSTAKDSKPTSKRSSETTKSDEKERSKKKAKVSGEDLKREKSSGGLVGRVCSEEDEIRILSGMIDYQKQKGADASADMGAFYDFVKGKLQAEITKTQLYEKVRRLKQKYFKTVERVGKGEDLVFSKPHEGESFDLSKRIWGGGLVSHGDGEKVNANGKIDGEKVKKNSKGNGEKLNANGKSDGEKVKKTKVESSDASVKKHEKIEVKNPTTKHDKIEEKNLLRGEVKDDNDGADFGEKYPFTLQAYNGMGGLITADQITFMKANLSVVGSETSKEFEEKWKQLQVEETEILLKKLQVFADHTKRVLDAIKK